MFRWVTVVLLLGLAVFRITEAIDGDELWLETVEERTAAGGQSLSIVGKTARQSSTLGAYTAGKAVDGSSSAIMYPDTKCSHTTGNSRHPWWMVDIGEEHCISKVRILNRGDCCSERLEGAIVRAGNSNSATVNPTCGSPVTAAQASPLAGTIEFDCTSPLRARYISVAIPGTATLQLCEVTVEELPIYHCITEPYSITHRPTEQSSTYDTERYPAGRAVDGSSSTILYPDNHCSHTKQEENPWWRVDLGDEVCVTKVTILNRGDCCSDRLTRAIVRAGTSKTITANQACGAPVTIEQAIPLGGTIAMECRRPLLARYVSVDIPGTAYLQLCEVFVEVLSSGLCSEEDEP